MDLMDDHDLKKSVIDKMMGELDDVTSSSLKKSPAAKGVEITIMVAPKGEESESGDDESGDDAVCDVDGCDDPMHDHADKEGAPGESNYISDLLKKMG